MEVALAVDHAKCIKCRRCVAVCPSAIFYQSVPGSEISLRNVNYCIVCGHCVAVCPTGAVVHGDFPSTKVHTVDKDILPAPESVMELLKSRRSNRAFSEKAVPDEILDKIVEAAHTAPTASNRQEVYYTVITDPQKLAMVVEYTVNSFERIVKKLNNPFLKPLLRPIMPGNYKMLRRIERLGKEYLKGNDPILRDATALLLIHTPSDNRFGRDDSNLAYQNGSLMAESLGVAQFYTGYLCTALHSDRKNRLAAELGIEGTIHCGMALGMPQFTYPKYIDRREVSLRKL